MKVMQSVCGKPGFVLSKIGIVITVTYSIKWLICQKQIRLKIYELF